jgi:hypothetical protein
MPNGANVTFKWTLTHKENNNTCTTTKEFNVTNNRFSFTAGNNANAACDGTFTLQGTYPAGVANATGYWEADQTFVYTDGETASTNANAKVSSLNNTTPTNFTWKVTAKGCTDERKVEITNNQVETAYITPLASNIVCGDELSLNANDPDGKGKGRWITPDNIRYTKGTSTENIITVTNLAANKDQKFIWRISKSNGNGKDCVSDASVTVTNMKYEAQITVPFTITEEQSQNIVICKDNIKLQANDVASEYGVNGWWEIVDGSASTATLASASNSYMMTVQNLPYGKTTMRWYAHDAEAQCEESWAEIVVINESLTTNAGDDDFTCNGVYESLTASKPNSECHGEWTLLSGKNKTDVTFANSGNYISKIGGLSSGAYQFRWTVYSEHYKVDAQGNVTEGCKVSDEVVINADGFTVDADNSASSQERDICGPKARVIASEYDGYWTVVPNDGTVVINSPSYYDINVDLGVNTQAKLTWHAQYKGCEDDDDITLHNIQPTIVDAGKDVYYSCEPDGKVTLNAKDVSANGMTGVWEKKSPTLKGSFNGNSTSGVNEYNAVYSGIDPNSSVELVWKVTSKFTDADGVEKDCPAYDYAKVVNNYYKPTVYIAPEVCGLDTVVSGEMPSSGYIGTWTCTTSDDVTFANANDSKTTVKGLEFGLNTIRWTVANTTGDVVCEKNYAEVTVDNIYPGYPEILTNAGQEVETCNGEQELQAKAPSVDGVEGYWYTNRSGSFKDGISASSLVTLTSMSADDNLLTWRIFRTGHNKCYVESTINVVNNEVHIGAEPEDAYTCGGVYTLSAEDPVVNNGASAYGRWTMKTNGKNASIDNSESSTIQISGIKPNNSEIFTWTVYKGNNCHDSYEVTIANHSVLAEAHAKNDKNTVCVPSVELVATSITQYGSDAKGYWSLSDYPDTRIADSKTIVIEKSDKVNTVVNGLSQNGQYAFAWNVYREVNGSRVCDTAAVVNITNAMFTVDADVNVDNEHGKSASACGGVYDLHASTLSSGVTDQSWTVVSPANATGISIDNISAAVTTVRGLTNDGVTLKWTVSNGSCENSDEIKIYNDRFEAYAAPEADFICNGAEGIKMTTTNDLTDMNTRGFWSTTAASGTFSENSDEHVTTATGVSATYRFLKPGTTATFTWTVVHGSTVNTCTASTSFTVTNREFTVYAGSDGHTEAIDGKNCSDTYVLKADALSDEVRKDENGNVIGRWTGVWTVDTQVEFSNASSAATVVSGLSNKVPNNFKWTVTDPYGCTVSDEVTVMNNAVDEAVIETGDRVQICSTPYEIKARQVSEGEGHWEYEHGSLTPKDNKSYNVAVDNLTPNSTATFTWVVERQNGNNGKCTSRASIELSNKDYEAKILTAVPVGETSVLTCGNTLVSKDGTAYTLQSENSLEKYGVPGHWETDNAVTFTNEGSNTANIISVSGLPYGLTKFTWVLDGPCPFDAQKHQKSITVNNETVSADAGNDVVTCRSNYDGLRAQDPSYLGNGLWTVESGSNMTNVTIASPSSYYTVIKGMTSGPYKFKWTVTSPHGCQISDEMTVNHNGFVVEYADMYGTQVKDVNNNDVPFSRQRYVCGEATPADKSLTASLPGEGQFGHWILPAGVTVDNSTNYITNVTGGIKKEGVTLVWHIGDAENIADEKCYAEASVTLYNRKPVANAQNKYYTCNGEIDNLIATAAVDGTTGVWSKAVPSMNGWFDNSADKTTNVNARFFGMDNNSTIKLLWTVTDNEFPECGTSVEAEVTNYAFKPTVATTNGVTLDCTNEFELEGKIPATGYTGAWSADKNVTFTSVDESSLTVTATVSRGPNTIFWTVTSDGTANGKHCEYPAQITVTDNRPVQAVIKAKTETCDNTAVLTSEAYDEEDFDKGLVHGLWSTTGGAKADGASVDVTTVTFTKLALNRNDFKWTLTKGACTTEATWTVVNNYVEANYAGYDHSVSEISLYSCDNTKGLQAEDNTVAYPGSNGWWSSLNGSAFLVNGNTVSTTSVATVTAVDVPAQGDVLTWTVSKGNCTDSKIVNISNFYVEADIPETEKTICSDDELELVAQNISAYGTSAKGYWKLESAPEGFNTSTFAGFENSTTYTTAVSGLTAKGSYKFSWNVYYDNNGTSVCKKSDYITVHNAKFDENEFVTTEMKAYICEDSYTMNVTKPTGMTGYWEIPAGVEYANGISASTDPKAKFVKLSNQESNTFIWHVTKDESGCKSERKVTVYDNRPNVPKIDKPSDSEIICEDYVQLQAIDVDSKAVFMQWTCEDPAVTFDGETTAQTVTARNLKVNSTTTFTWTVGRDRGDGTGRFCKEKADVKVTNTYYEAKLLSADKTVCSKDETVTLSAYSIAESAATGWWTASDNSVDETTATTESITVTNFGHGSTTYTWHVVKGQCDTKTAQVVITNSEVTSRAAQGFTTCVEDNVPLTADENDLNNKAVGRWMKDFNDDKVTIKDITSYSTTVSGLSGDKYTFKWVVTSEDGKCVSESSLTINDNYFTTSIMKHVDHKLNVCGSDGIAIQAVKPTERGEWTTTDNIVINEGSSNHIITVDGVTETATLKWTEYRGTGADMCSAEDYVTLTNRKPKLNATTSYTTCNGDVELVATLGKDGEIGVWSKVAESYSGYFGTVLNQTSATTATMTVYHGVDPNKEIKLRWTVTDNVMTTCSDNIEATVKSFQFEPVIKLDNDQVCDGNKEYSVTGTIPAEGYYGEWTSTTNSVVFAESTNPSTTFTGLARGVNELIWTVYDNNKVCSENVATRKIYNNAPSQAEILNSRTKEGLQTCDGTMELRVTEPETGETGSWKALNGNITFTADEASPTKLTVATGFAPNSKTTLEFKVSKGKCETKDTISIFSNEIVAIAGVKQESCDGTAILGATDPSELVYKGAGEWTVSNEDVVFENGNNTLADAHVSNLPNGESIFTWTVTKGKCVETNSVVVVNNTIKAEITNVAANEDGEKILYSCNDSELLKANNITGSGATGYWKRGPADDLYIASTGNLATASHFKLGSNHITWNVEKGICKASDEVTIVSNVVHTSITGVDENNRIYTCDDFQKLSAVLPSGCTGQWTKVSGTVSIEGNMTSSAITLTSLPNDLEVEMKWTVTSTTNSECKDEKFVIVKSNKVKALVDQDMITTCSGEVTINGNSESNSVSWWTPATPSNKGKIGNSAAAETTVTGVAHDSQEKFIWHVSLGTKGSTEKGRYCEDSDTVTVVNNGFDLSAGGTLWPAKVVGTDIYGNDVVEGDNQYYYGNYMNDPDDILCNDYITLQGTSYSAGEGVWEITSGTGGVIDESDIHNPNAKLHIAAGATVNLKWSYTKNNCPQEAFATVISSRVVAEAKGRVTCDDNTTLQGILKSGETGVWTAANPDKVKIAESTLYNSKVTGLNPGQNAFTWAVTNGRCSNSTPVTVNYLIPDAQLPNTLRDNYCGYEYNLTASKDPSLENCTGLWTVVLGTGKIANPTNWHTQVTNLVRGVNVIKWEVTSEGGCKGSSTLTINNIAPNVSLSDYASECGPNGVVEASELEPGTHGLWTMKARSAYDEFVILSPSSNITEYYGARQGNTYLVWTVTVDQDPNDPRPACSVSKEVTVNNKSITVYVEDPHDYCSEEVTLVGTRLNNGDEGYWSAGPNSYVVFSSPSNYMTKASNLEFGHNMITWNVTAKNGCSNYGLVDVIHRSYPGFTAGDDDKTCKESYRLGAMGPGSYEREEDLDKVITKWEVISGAETLDFANKNYTPYNAEVTGLGLGKNVLRWQVDNRGIYGAQGCVMSDDITITNNGVRANAGAGSDGHEIVLCEDFYEFFAIMPEVYDSVTWEVGYGTGKFDIRRTDNDNLPMYASTTNPYSSACNNTVVRNLSHGTSTFQWHVHYNGCDTYDEVVIKNVAPDKAVVMASTPICSSDYHLSANAPKVGKGEWSIVGDSETSPVKIDDKYANYTEIHNVPVGQSRFIWKITNEEEGHVCTSEAEVVLSNEDVRTSAGQDHVTCETNDVLQAQDPGIYSGRWEHVTKQGVIENSTAFTTNITGLQIGGNTFRWVIDNGICQASALVTIMVNKPTQAYAGKDQSSCTDFTTLIANTPGVDEIGYWRPLTGSGTCLESTSFKTKVTGMSNGKNMFEWTIIRGGESEDDPNACVSKSVVEVTSRNVMMSVSSSADEYCSDEGEVYGYVNVDDYTSKWEPIGGFATFDESTLPNTKVRNLQEGMNVLRWTVTTVENDVKCESYKDITVVNNTPPQAIVPDSKMSCDTFANILGNMPPHNTYGEWSVAQGVGEFENSTAYSTKVYGLSGDSDNFIVWTIHKGICTSTDTIRIAVNKMLTNTSGDNGTDTLEICGTKSPISAAPAPAGARGWWETTSRSAVIENSESENATVTGVTTGAHTLIWHVKMDDDSGCNASARLVVVNNLYKATASLATANPICDGYATLIGNQPSGGGVGFWTVPQTAKVSDSTTPVTTMYPTVNGVNTAYWHIKKGKCEASASVVVENYTVNAELGDDITACDVDEVKTIAAQKPPVGGYGYWENPNGHVDIEDSNNNITTVTNIQQGANTVVWHVFSPEVLGSDGSMTRCHSQGELVVNNNSFTTSAGQDFEVCDTITEISAMYQGPDAKGYWTGGNFVNSTANRTFVYGMAPASTNIYRWTVEMNNCTAYDEVVVYNRQVEITISSGDKIVCTPSTNLEAHQSAGTGVWDVTQGGGYIPMSTSQTAMVENLRHGKNTIRWTVTNGNKNCKTFKEVVVDNQSIEITAGYNQTTCDTFATLAGQPLGPNQTGTWTWGSDSRATIVASGDVPHFDDEHLYNTRVTGLFYNDDGLGYSNAFTWHVKDSITRCEAEATVQIISYHFVVDADTSSVDNHHVVEDRANNSVQLTAKIRPTYTGEWHTIMGSGVATPKDRPTTTVTNLSQGLNQIMWTATLITESPDGVSTILPCKASDIVEVAYTAFDVEAGANISICEDSVQLNAQKVEKAVAFWTSGNKGGYFKNSTDPKTWVYGLTRGKNVLYWNVTKNGYTAVDSVIVWNHAFDVDAGKDQHLCTDYTQLKASKPYGNALLDMSSAETDEDGEPVEGPTVIVSGSWDTPYGGVHYFEPNKRDTKIDSIHATTNVLVWRNKVTYEDLDKIGVYNRTRLTCYDQDTVRITYYVAPQPDFKIIPKTAAGCAPFTAQFKNTTVNTDTTDAVFYRWNFGNIVSYETPDHDSIRVHTFDNDSDHDSVLTVWLTTGLKIPNDVCYSTDSSEIIIYNVPIADIDLSSTIYKQPNMKVEMYAVNVPGPFTRYTWNFGDGTGDVWEDNTKFRSSEVHEYATFGEYTVVLDVKNKHCASSDTAKVTILPAAPTRIKTPAKYPGCAPYLHELQEGVRFADSVRWDIYYAVDSTTLQAQLTYPDGENGQYLFNKVGRYILKEYAYGPGVDGEMFMRADTVVVNPTPEVNFTIHPDTVRLPNVPLFTSNTSTEGSRYEWNFGDGAISAEMEPVHYYETPGDYYVNLTVYSKENCSAHGKEVPVRVEAEGMLRFPTAFVPDPSGPCGGVETKFRNYVFLPYPRNGVKKGTYKLEIFNRYGEKIYESDDPDIGWDGYYRGELCKQDVYVFKCRCTFENGKLFKQIGNVTLLR